MIKTENKQSISIIAGVSLLLMAAMAGVGYGYAFNNFYIADDKAATVNSLIQSPANIYVAIVTFISIFILDIIVAFALYVLYKRESKTLPIITSCLRFVYSVILGIAVYYLMLASLNMVLKNDDAIMRNLNLFLKIWHRGLIIFGVHLFTLGLLIKKVAPAAELIYGMLLLAGCCYFLANSLDLLLPAYKNYKENIDMVLALPMALGELMFAFWLIFKRKK